jgi:hypothetical protein
MQVLTSNVKLTFTCENDKCINFESGEKIETDPFDVSISGVPMCPECNEQASIDEYCFIKN